MMRVARLCVFFIAVVIIPTAVFAQATIAGTVRDTSGAVLPGVTVEAASPALIEKVRSVVTDGSGQFRIVDLRPGSYTVTFALAGFSTVRRDGLEVTGSATFQVNAELRVGALEETITVTGETPVVDVQSVRTQAVLSQEVLSTIPTARNYQNMYVLVPGITVASGSQDVGGAGGDQQIFFAAHGGEVRDSRLQMNGMMIGAPQVGGGRTMYVPHAAAQQEVAVTTSGGLGEAETAGVVVNMIPQDGGNVFRGSIFATGATEGMIADNYDAELQAAGLRAPNNAKSVYDYEGTLGGPIKRDKIWFFFNTRYNGADNYVAGMFVNKNAGDPTKFLYDPDFNQQIVRDQYWLGVSMRVTAQPTPRNKIAGFYEDQLRCVGCKFNGSATQTDEASGVAPSHPNNVGQITWTSPVSNRLLLEAGGSLYQLRYGQRPKAEHYNPELIRITEQAGLIPGLQYRAIGTQYYKNWLATYGSRASMTYTTGQHSMKFGYNGTFYIQDSGASSYTGLEYRFRDGVPNQLTESAHPFHYWTHANQWGLYAQDQSTFGKLTVAGGMRYDRFTTYYPEATLGGVRFVPQVLTIPAAKGAALNDISFRGTAAYDVFGDGKTALKVSMGKYVLAQDSNGVPLGPRLGAPADRLATTTSRAWTDANRDFVPDCDLLNLGANGECGAAANQNFGKLVFANRQIDPEVYSGWGVRPYNWTFDVGIQRELMPRVSASFTYFRRWFGNFLVTDNTLVGATDYDYFNFPVPPDQRLPITGVIDGYASINPAKFGQQADLVTAASNYGKQTQIWNGYDASVNARLSGLLLQGGLSSGRNSTDNCEIVEKLPELLGNFPKSYCHVVEAFQTQVKLLGAYTIPKVSLQVAATLQNIPGQQVDANYAAPNAVIAPILGRPLAGGAATQTLALLQTGQEYSPRVNQLDVRFSRLQRMGAARTLRLSLDLFNALNANTVQTYNANYSPTGAWRVPTAILPARVAKVSAQFDF